MEYVAFDIAYMMEMFNTIRYNLGNIFSVAFYLFIAVLGVYVVLNVVQTFGQ